MILLGKVFPTSMLLRQKPHINWLNNGEKKVHTCIVESMNTKKSFFVKMQR